MKTSLRMLAAGTEFSLKVYGVERTNSRVRRASVRNIEEEGQHLERLEMMDDPDMFAQAILALSAGYLCYRLIGVFIRASRSRRAYPVVSELGEPDDRVLGCLLGVAAGDSVGLAAEGLPSWLIRLRYPGGPRLRSGLVRWARRKGDVSDDTQLTIAVARSILPGGEYSHERFLDELRRFRAFAVGAGPGTFRAASRLWRTRNASALKNKSDGNGVAIRVAPLALCAKSDEELLATVAINASATHGGKLALAGARLVALLVRRARHDELPLDDGGLLERVIEKLAERAEFPLARYHAAGARGGISEQLKIAGTGAYALESVTALLLLLRTHGGQFSAGCRSAFFAGGDVDSICSLYGAVAGAAMGADAIPPEWRRVSCESTLKVLARMLVRPAFRPAATRLTRVHGNLATQEVDLIVNAWNRNLIPAWLLIPQGVSRAIRRAGGGSTIAEVSTMPALPLGGAVETQGRGLSANWVVHAAGINLVWTASERSVADSVRTSLLLARYLGARTVALPLIGAGSGRLGEEKASKIVSGECERAKEWFDEVRVVKR